MGAKLSGKGFHKEGKVVGQEGGERGMGKGGGVRGQGGWNLYFN